MRTTYTRAHDAMIRGSARKGESFSQAAKSMGGEHNRNTVAGRAHRLGVKFSGKMGRPKGDCE